jgi:hypothetical protein
MSDKSTFLENAIASLSNLTRIEVNTLVGDYKFNSVGSGSVTPNGGDESVDNGVKTTIIPDSTIERMCSQINLLTGDITTAMTEKFVVDYKELREYHAIRENQGHDIVMKNIEILTKIVETLIDFSKKKTSGE